MKAPWFPFYTGDFLASTDVQLMEAHEVGAYLLLLAHSWQSDAPGYLPNDEGRLRRLARLSVEQWKECGGLLLSKWPEAAEDASLRYNPRLLKEAGKQVEMREIKAEAGRKSAERRARLATEGQQTGNTNPTGVEIKSTGVGQKSNYSQPQPQPQPQEGKPSSSLRSEDAASAAASAPEKKIESASLQPENPPADASHTRGAADVPTRKARPHAYDPADIATGLVLPFDTDEFRALWAGWRQYREEQKLPRLNGGMQEQEALRHLRNLAPDYETAAAIIAQAIRNGWKNLFKLDAPSLANPTPHSHAVTQRSFAQPHGAAARLHTPAPDHDKGWGYPGG